MVFCFACRLCQWRVRGRAAEDVVNMYRYWKEKHEWLSTTPQKEGPPAQAVGNPIQDWVCRRVRDQTQLYILRGQCQPD